MSEPRLISPMLDGFALGGPISSHSGVTCYPAMRADSDERYIVKTISVPASQVQLEALLLTGAYPDAEAAREYFKDLAKGIRSEIEILDKCAARRGFLGFQNSQIVPMEEGVGYEVYLLSYYRRTLARHMKRQPLTHLSAINLGIDIMKFLRICEITNKIIAGSSRDHAKFNVGIFRSAVDDFINRTVATNADKTLFFRGDSNH